MILLGDSAGAGDKPLVLKKHAKPVLGLAYSPDGKTLASSDEDGVIHLWDASTWKPRATMNMPAKFVKSVAWSGDSKMLVTGDKAKHAQLWDADTGKALGEPFNQERSVWAATLSKDGKRLATGGNGSAVRVWDVETRKQLGVYQSGQGFVHTLAFSPDAKLLIAGGGLPGLRIYHLDKIEGEGHVAMKATKAAFSGDGKVLAGIHYSKAVFSPDAKVFVSSHFTVTVRDMTTGKDRCTFEAVKKGSNTFHAIAVNADGSLIAVAIDQTLQLFDGQTGKHVADLQGHTMSVSALSFSPDGKKLASSGDTTIRLWDVPGKAAVAFKDEADKLTITVGDAPFATYVHRDAKIPRPYFAHVHAPGGIQVTRNHPPVAGKDATDHAEFHPGLWLAFGDMSGADSWRLKAPVRHEKFLMKPDAGAFAVENTYLAADGKKAIASETCRFTILVRPAGTLLLWDSEIRPLDGDLTFGDQEEMGLGVRVATPLTVKAGGRILTSEGHKNEKQTRGKTSPWCDYAGTSGGRFIGITLMQHPKNFRPAWYHARDYGLLVANPFGRNALTGGERSRVVVKQGETLRLRYGVLVHAHADADKLDLDATYRDYLEWTGDK